MCFRYFIYLFLLDGEFISWALWNCWPFVHEGTTAHGSPAPFLERAYMSSLSGSGTFCFPTERVHDVGRSHSEPKLIEILAWRIHCYWWILSQSSIELLYFLYNTDFLLQPKREVSLLGFALILKNTCERWFSVAYNEDVHPFEGCQWLYSTSEILKTSPVHFFGLAKSHDIFW